MRKSIPVLILAAIGCAKLIAPSPIPSGITFVPRTQWGAHAPVLPMKEHTPVRLTIHHTGVAQNFSRTLEAKIKALQEFSQREDSLSSGQKKPAWADVPYHYYISVDGRVAEGREWKYVGDSNTPYDPSGHLLVVVEGNFEKDTLTTAQRVTLDSFIPALARYFHIRSSALASHR
ncbi:MAG: N-acetylmuramoyl-L-alanine amidase, partial [Gemmatimonadaceae bacterium]|nr:N-acetylmuramoyl-L-alanine amidase [Gemmatimonadaceae bacterium]